MKKFLLLSCIPLMLAACTGSGDKKAADSTADSAAALTAAAAPPLTNHIKTLNGVEESKVKDMLDNFEQSMSDTQPAVQNFFINRTMLTNIVNLLDYERAHPKPGQLPTDGLRIYFAKKTAGGPTSLLLISTREFAPMASLPNKTHDDYYEHSSALADVLFRSIPALDVPTYDNQRPGAVLYKPSNVNEQPCNTGNTHYITRHDGEIMVKHFNDSNLPINTYAEWFDIDFFKYLLKDTRMTGIRIYLGRHPGTHHSYANQVAFIVMPTHRINNNDEDNFDCNTLKDYYKANKLLHKNRFNPYDNGELCPLNCN